MRNFIATPQMSISDAINSATSNIFKFSGRARRSEFWWTMLVVYAFQIVLPPIGFVFSVLSIPLTFRRLHDTGRSGWWYVFFYIMGFILLMIFIINIVRWFCFFDSSYYAPVDDTLFATTFIKHFIAWIVMVVYGIILFIFLCQDSEKEANKYGESPKYRLEEEVSQNSTECEGNNS